MWTKAGQMLSYLPFLDYRVDVDSLVLIGGLRKSRPPSLTTLWVHMCISLLGFATIPTLPIRKRTCASSLPTLADLRSSSVNPLRYSRLHPSTKSIVCIYTRSLSICLKSLLDIGEV